MRVRASVMVADDGVGASLAVARGALGWVLCLRLGRGHSVLVIRCTRFPRRSCRLGRRDGAEVDLCAAFGCVDELADGVGEAAGADIVQGEYGVVGTVAKGVQHGLGASLHFGVVALGLS